MFTIVFQTHSFSANIDIMLISFVNVRRWSSTFFFLNPGMTSSLLPRRFQKALCARHSVKKTKTKKQGKLSSTGVIISSVDTGEQGEVKRSASTRNCPWDTLRSRCASPTEALKESETASPWLKDCDELSPAVSTAAEAAAHHCLPCACVRQVLSAGAGAPHGSNVMSCTTQARAWIWAVRAHVDARECVQTEARAQERFATNTPHTNPKLTTDSTGRFC